MSYGTKANRWRAVHKQLTGVIAGLAAILFFTIWGTWDHVKSGLQRHPMVVHPRDYYMAGAEMVVIFLLVQVRDFAASRMAHNFDHQSTANYARGIMPGLADSEYQRVSKIKRKVSGSG